MTVKWNLKKADEVTEKAERKLIAIGFMIARDAKEYCPVDSGRLRASISVNWTGSGMARGATDSYQGGKRRKVTNDFAAQLEGVASADDGVGQPPPTSYRFAVVVGTNVRYAPFVEFGTSTMGNIPFLRVAIQRNRAEISGGAIQRNDVFEGGGR